MLSASPKQHAPDYAPLYKSSIYNAHID